MSGVSIIVDDGQLRAGLARLSAAMRDMTFAFDDIGSALAVSTRQRFEHQRDPSGRPWRPLSFETILRRLGGKRKAFTKKGALRKPAARQLEHLKILQVSGNLRDSITHNAAPDQVEVGTNVAYARIHQFGGKAGRGRKVTVPPRAFLGLDADDGAMIEERIAEHLRRALGGRP